jgi:hypothetical protein
MRDIGFLQRGDVLGRQFGRIRAATAAAEPPEDPPAL